MRGGSVVVISVLLGWSQAIASDQIPASCQEQLLVTTMHAHVLQEQRAGVEQQLAQMQALNSVLQQKLKFVTTENDTLKAKLKAAAPREP